MAFEKNFFLIVKSFISNSKNKKRKEKNEKNLNN